MVLKLIFCFLYTCFMLVHLCSGCTKIACLMLSKQRNTTVKAYTAHTSVIFEICVYLNVFPHACLSVWLCLCSPPLSLPQLGVSLSVKHLTRMGLPRDLRGRRLQANKARLAAWPTFPLPPYSQSEQLKRSWLFGSSFQFVSDCLD